MDDNSYIPGLHINSEREPGLASKAFEMRMNEIGKTMRRKGAKYSRRYIHPNLTEIQAGLIKRLSKNKTYKVTTADNNCGLTIIKTEHLAKRMVTDHLGNATTYKRLIKEKILCIA